jgi:hypothetical protein
MMVRVFTNSGPTFESFWNCEHGYREDVSKLLVFIQLENVIPVQSTSLKGGVWQATCGKSDSRTAH